MPAAAVAFHALVVEDDPSSCEFITRAVTRTGIESQVATSVGQALLRVEQAWPPAVILDLRLPDADGTVLLRRLRRDSRACRVAVTTGVTDLSGYSEPTKFPPDVLLHKPVDLQRLLRWLDRTRAEWASSSSPP